MRKINSLSNILQLSLSLFLISSLSLTFTRSVFLRSKHIRQQQPLSIKHNACVFFADGLIFALKMDPLKENAISLTLSSDAAYSL